MGETVKLIDATWSPLTEGTDPIHHWKRPRVVRLAHDIFDRHVTSETIRAAWDAMWAAPKHRFLVVTNDTGRLRKWTHRNAFMRHFGWVDFDRLPTMNPGVQIHMDELYYRGRCGWVNDGIESNGGYGCSHPGNEEDGECHGYACPIAYEAGLCANCEHPEEDCTCGHYQENHDLMELHSRPRYAVACNVWIGTTVTTLGEARERFPALMRAKATVRFVESVPGLDLSEWIQHGAEVSAERGSSLSEDWSIAWVVINGVWTPTTRMDRRNHHLPMF